VQLQQPLAPPHEISAASKSPAEISFFPQEARILLVANSAWNLWNFRRSLFQQLQILGCRVITAAPADDFSAHLPHFIALRHLSRKSLSPLSNLRTLGELIRVLRSQKPGLAVFYTIKPNIFGAWAARLSGVPSVAVIEGLGYTARAHPLLRRMIFRLYRSALSHSRKVIFLNHDDQAEFLYHRMVTPGKTLVIKGIGVDTEYFKPGIFPAGANVGDTFLFIGRLLHDKGIREFVRAASLIKQAYPAARFQILGGLDEDNPASIAAGELSAWLDEAVVEYLGQTDDVRPYIAAADAVVLPSYREGMPRVLLEGMAMGKPVITTDSVGCRDTVDEGENGFIVPSEDSEALRQALLRFLQLNPADRAEMGRKSREKALREFSNEAVLRQYIRVFWECGRF
jgi:glycosyltransferase involved in cell wall biosynthesis